MTAVASSTERLGDPGPGHPGGRGTSPLGAVARLLAVVVGGLVLAALFGALPTVFVVLAIVACIGLHELGHFVMAKLGGMKVTEFFIGFGPRLWSLRRGETVYGIKAIPAGAYVRVVGMSSLDEVDPADEPRAYRQATFPRRIGVAVAGSAMHFLIALVLLVSLYGIVGIPRATSGTEIGGFVPLQGVSNPARAAGLQVGDVVVSADGAPLRSMSAFIDAIKSHAGQPVRLVVEKGGHYHVAVLRPANVRLHPEQGTRPLARSGPPVGAIGVMLAHPTTSVTLGPLSSLVHSARTIGWYSAVSIQSLGARFSPSGITSYVSQLTGHRVSAASAGGRLESPIGVVRLASQAAHTNIANVLWLLVAINIFVGLFNMVPLLPLDGGHVAVAVYERIRSRRGHPYHADAARLLPATYAVFALIVVLGITAAYLDVVHPLPNPFQ